jgi:maltose alpha-D-glucosyltransferase/alpha-amylase
LLAAEQSNSSVRYGDRLMLKLFRRPGEGVNPDLELGRVLTERKFANTPPVAGALEYQRARGEPITIATLHGFVPNEGDAWSYTLEEVRRFFERALARVRGGDTPEVPNDLLSLITCEPPALVGEVVGAYLEKVRLLGVRTAEMHIALGAPSEDPQLAPEPFSTLYQRSLYQSVRTLTGRTLRALRDRIDTLPDAVREDASALLQRENALLRAFQTITTRKLGAIRTRIHGDYHLGQVLHTGRDFVIIDFEGEPARTLGERRLKRSPLKDVAGMLRSFDYAVHYVLNTHDDSGAIRTEDVASLVPWGRFWRGWVRSAFVRSYLRNAERLVPASRADLELLFRFLLLEKSVYELGYELDNRPAWVGVPLRGVLDLVGPER